MQLDIVVNTTTQNDERANIAEEVESPEHALAVAEKARGLLDVIVTNVKHQHEAKELDEVEIVHPPSFGDNPVVREQVQLAHKAQAEDTQAAVSEGEASIFHIDEVNLVDQHHDGGNYH